MPEDAIARVGDQIITFHEIDVMINSSAMLGLPLPSPGTEERDLLRLHFLDLAISENLLYLDAVRAGVDKTPAYRDDMKRFADSVLASLYRDQVLIGDISVGDEAIRDYYERNIVDGTPFTADLHEAIASKLRKEKYTQRIATQRERLREGTKVEIRQEVLLPARDADRRSSEIVAMVGGDEAITWGEVRSAVQGTDGSVSLADRLSALDRIVDRRIMVRRAHAAGLDRHDDYLRRVDEFGKSRLVNIHRSQLMAKAEPSQQELEDFFARRRTEISIPEGRRIQMIVLRSRDEALRVKRKIDRGELTIYEAAAQFSIDPNAKTSLGELGWVAEGTGFPDLDELTFTAPVGKVVGPVESPAGWHLVKVLETREARFMDLSDRETSNKTRRMLMKEEEARYLTRLRQEVFTVEVYEETFSRLAREELASLGGQEVRRTSDL